MWIKPKYRIKQIGNKYYPQKKNFLFWRRIKASFCSVSSYGDRVRDVDEHSSFVWTFALETADKFIKSYIECYLPDFRCRRYLIGSYYERSDNKFFYIEKRQHKFFSDCAETVCEKIVLYDDERKEKLKEAKKVTIHEYRES